MTGGGVAISVIVPVRDDAEGIATLLAHLSRQTVPRERFEVIIGDDGSSPPLRLDPAAGATVVRGGARTSYDARNRAVAAARGEILAFCDSDCRPDPDWLARGQAALDGADVAAGRVRFAKPDRPTVWSLLTVDMFLDQEQNVRLERAVTANLFVRRSIFEQVGGFDPTLPSGGDYDFVAHAQAAGGKLVYAPDAVLAHPTMDRGDEVIGKVWSTNRWSGTRRARDGMRPELSGVMALLPVLGVALARRAALRPGWRLSRQRLRDADLEPSWTSHVAAVLLLHTVVAGAAGLGRARGWIGGTVMRRRQRAGLTAGRPRQARGEAAP